MLHERSLLVCFALLVIPQAAGAQTRDVTVAAATRLDWTFVAERFGADAAKLPAGFDSTKQRYQLFVPKNYQKSKAWPLIVFISAGEQPAAWNNWKAVCEK